jgi:hypothetical protein
MKRREEKRRFWSDLMARFEVSGKSRRQFAAEAGVGLPIFQYWLYKLQRERPKAVTVRRPPLKEVRLVPVTVRPGLVAVPIEVCVAGFRVRVPVGVDPEYVARLALALRETKAC